MILHRERKPDLAMGAAPDEHALALDAELLDLPRDVPGLELEDAHGLRARS